MGHLQRRNQKIKSLFSFQHQTQPFSSLQKKIQTALIFSASNPTRFHLLGIKPNPFPSSEPQTQPVPIFLASNPTLTHLLSVPNPFISFQHQTPTCYHLLRTKPNPFSLHPSQFLLLLLSAPSLI